MKKTGISQETIFYLFCQKTDKKYLMIKYIKEDEHFGEVLINILKFEREKFSENNKEYMQWLIDILVESCVYPKSTPVMDSQGYTHMDMISSWGVDCFSWTGLINCPHCNTDWRDYETGPPGKRQIGIEIRGVYDGILYYKCPDCGKATSRKGNKLSEKEIKDPTIEILMK